MITRPAARLPRTRHLTVVRPGIAYALPRKIRALADGGQSWETLGYTTKFAARKAILYALYIRGWSRDDAYRYVLARERPAADLWASTRRDIGHAGMLARFTRDWRQVETFAYMQRRTRADARAIIGELKAHATARDWKGRAGRTDRDVYGVALVFAEASVSLHVRMAEREVAMRAGMCNATAHKSLGRLTMAGWLARTSEPRHPDQATQYRLLTKHLLHSRSNSDQTIRADSGNPPESKSGYFCNNPAEIAGTELAVLLGKAACDIIRALTDQPQTPAEIARRANVHRATAGRKLRAVLAREGLATETPGGWIAGPEDWRTYDPGTTRAADRAAQYERERDAYARHLAGKTGQTAM